MSAFVSKGELQFCYNIKKIFIAYATNCFFLVLVFFPECTEKVFCFYYSNLVENDEA